MSSSTILPSSGPTSSGPASSTPASSESAPTLRQWSALAALSAAVFLVSLDATILDIALPHITDALRPSTTGMLWIVDAYSFVLGALLITAGNLGDRIGRKKLLLLGAVAFGVASIVAAFAPSAAALIAARVLQGLAGATLMPSTLALIRTTFTGARSRATAVAVWSATAAAGAAAGPLVGGLLLEHFWWGSVFLTNVPVIVVIVIVGWYALDESADPNAPRLDPTSVALSIATMIPVVYAIKETATHGLSVSMSALALLGIGAGYLFVLRQRSLTTPLIDVALFARPAFAIAVLANLLSVFALSGMLFFGAQYLQLVLGLSALEAGLVMAPGMVVSAAAALIAAPILRSFSSRVALVTALLIEAVGAILLVLTDSSGPAVFVAASVFVGFGAGMALTVISNLVLTTVPADRAGSASAVAETAYETGVALGIAVLGSLAMAVFRSGVNVSALDGHAAAAARESLAAAMSTGSEAVTNSAADAFVTGMHTAAATAALIIFACAAAAWRMMRPAADAG